MENDEFEVTKEKLGEEKTQMTEEIVNRHKEAAEEIKESLNNILENNMVERIETEEKIKNITDRFDKLME